MQLPKEKSVRADGHLWGQSSGLSMQMHFKSGPLSSVMTLIFCGRGKENSVHMFATCVSSSNFPGTKRDLETLNCN